MINTDKNLTDNGHKRAAQPSLQLLPLIMNNIPQAVFWKDKDLVYLGCNRAFAEDAGLSSPEEIVGKTDFDMPWKDQAELYRADDRHVLDSGEPKLNYEEPQTTPGGSTTWLRTSKIPVYENDQIVAILGMYEDITAHKQTEEALQENQLLYQSLVEVSPLSICRKDLAGRFTFANQRFLELSQTTLADLVGKTDFDLHPSELAEKYRRDDLAVMESGQVEEIIEERAVHEGGTALVQTIKAPIYDGTGKVNGIQISFWDITDRKRAEEAIQASEERFRRFTEATNEGLVFHEQGTIIDANPAAITLFGLSEDKDFIGKNLLEFVVPESHGLILEKLQLETVLPYEVQCIRNNGSIFPVETSTRTYKSGNRTIRATSLRDITERKRAEADLLLRDRALASSLNAVLVVGLDFKPIYVNESFLKMTGYSYEEAMRLTITDLSAYPEGLKRIDEATHTQGFFIGEESIKRKDGSIFPTDFFTSYITDDKGEPIAIQTAFTDITERKQAESQLQQEKSLSDAIINGLPGTFYLFDLQGRMIRWNKQYEKVSGYTAEEIPTMSVIDTLAEEDRESALATIQHAIAEGQGAVEANFVTKDGRRIPYYFAGQRLQIDDQIYMAGTGMDLTERKQAEQTLRENQKFLQTVMDNIPQSIFWKDKDLTYLGCNSAFAADAGVNSPSDIVGKNDWDMPWKEQAELYRADDSLVMKSGVPKLNYEEPQTNPQGQTTWLRTSKIPLYDSDGNVSAVLGMYEDITERKRLETQVREALERRGLQVQLSTQVSQSIAAASSLEELYERVVTQVRQEFGYYHTQLLRYDPVQEAVVLVTGYGEVGAQMLAAGHRLPMGEGLIGTAAATGETVLRPTLEHDPDWHPNPLLPETKGEIAVPIKLGDTVLGVLDVQSNTAGALDADDQLLLEGLCGQIAIAIESTRLHEDMSERMEEINRLYRAMSHEGWQTFREKTEVESGFIYDQAGLRPAQDITLAEELFATIPLTVPGGEVIGNLAVADDPQRPLTSEDETFLQQVSEQVALALESARLFEQTQSALATIQENEARLSEALNIAKLGHWEYDLERDRFTFNDQFYSIFRTTVKEVGSYELSSAEYSRRFVHPEDAPLVGKEIERGLASTDRHFSARVEHRIIFPDGELGYISVAITLERDENGKITRWYGANQDVTERKKAELAIQESQAALEEVMTVAGMANWELDLEKFEFTYNDRLYQMLGTTAEEEGGYKMSAEKYVGKYIHPEDAGLIMGAIQAGLQSPDPQNFKGSLEYRMIRKDGKLRYMLTDYRLIVNREGRPVAGVGSFLDITERKLAELTVAKRAEELKTVATVSTTASTVLDPDKLLQSVVDLAKERFSLYHAHIYTYDASWNTLLLSAGAGEVGRKLVAEEHAIPLTLEQSLVARAARERKPIIVNDVNSEPGFLPNPLLPETRAEMAVPMTVGDTLLGVFDVQSNSAPGFSDEDANIYVTLAAQVGVALQNARSYVEQAALVTQLRELDRLKSSFLANMSHELRTPLNSILGFADVIIEELDGPLTENMSNDLRLIQKNGQHLLHLINDVLDMAKIEAGRMNLNPEKFTAFEVIEEVTSITSTLASEKNLALFIEPDSDQNVKIYADRTRLRQVMINLVNNAIKFTENGKISLKLTALEGARVLFTIKDTGIGIPPDKLDAIFLEFTQVDSSTTRKAGGTGLGLPISRRLVEMHGGRLWAESTGVSGEGSTFFVELPVEARITETVEKQAK